MRFIVLFFAFVPIGVFAAPATFYLSPAVGDFSVGQTVKTTVYLDSGNNGINTAEATLNFPPENLRVASISKIGSIFPIWAVDPVFDNTNGTVAFAGGTTGSFMGPKGNVFSVTFHVKKSGAASLFLNLARILLADGLGTNVFSGAPGGANWNLKSVIAAPAPRAAGVPPLPVIVSASHPDPEVWYSDNSPKFSWELPADVTSVKILYDQLPDSEPTIFYSPPISERILGGVRDGIWYFHIRFLNNRGAGQTAHSPVRIDTEPPRPFMIQFPDGKKTTKAQARIDFTTTDSLSGIDRYEIKIDDGNWLNSQALNRSGSSYLLPEQGYGDHLIRIRAFDLAGNLVEAQDTLTIVRIDGVTIFVRSAEALALLLMLCLFVISLRRYYKAKHKINLMEKTLHQKFDQLRDISAFKQHKDDLDSAENSLKKAIQDLLKK